MKGSSAPDVRRGCQLFVGEVFRFHRLIFPGLACLRFRHLVEASHALAFALRLASLQRQCLQTGSACDLRTRGPRRAAVASARRPGLRQHPRQAGSRGLTTLGRMSHPPPPHRVRDRLASYFWSGDVICSRSVSDVVLSGAVDVPALPARLTADWERETSLRLGLEPGDVEALPLARARARWPDYRHCVASVSDWTRTLGLPEVLASCDVALMACRGAKYHHDGARYGGAAFCNLFLSEDRGLDLHFPATGHRFPLARGTAVIFDTGQPHAVIKRRSDGFDLADFAPDQDCTQVFLSWELPIENADVGRALRIDFDVDPSTSLQLDEEQVWLNGARASVCPDSGRWCRAD